MEYILEIDAHNSIYDANYKENNYKTRKLKIKYCEPEIIDKDTGILLFIPGYGGNFDSKVYNKIRKVFSDRYNLIVVQCEYFGNSYMSGMNEKELKDMYYKNDDIATKEYRYPLHENIYDMNDMGIMQAVDNITAVLSILKNVHERGLILNMRRTMIYGISHGAYLAYYCNRICPEFFQLIIDNSSYIIPVYMNNERILKGLIEVESEVKKLRIKYNYIIKDYIICPELYNLEELYSGFQNNSYIVCLHGTDDDMTSISEKSKFVNKINKMVFMEIGEKDLDGEVFRSCKHGLDGDFLKIFDFVYESFKTKYSFEPKENFKEKVEIVFMNQKGIILNYNNNTYEVNVDVMK